MKGGAVGPVGTSKAKLSRDLAEDLLYRLVLIREFEQALMEMFGRGELPGAVHLCIGQEAAAVGACAALDPNDAVIMNFRSHGHALARGSDPGRVMAEILGREAGFCGGKGGSIHFADASVGILAGSAIVGSQTAIGAGVGLASQVLGDSRVCLVFFGDGAAGEGLLYESLNFAGLWRLPVVYLCENNEYVATVRTASTLAGGSVAARAAGFDMPGVTVDGQSVEDVRAAVAEAVVRARQGEGPTLIEAKTFRFSEHAFGMRNVNEIGTQEEKDEANDWVSNRDPIRLFEALGLGLGVLDDQVIDAVRDRVREEIRVAREFAVASSEPPMTAAFEGMYTVPQMSHLVGDR
jgi:TPP-dependent pyruvate/acetoin dehydrogenase alpha subunit